MPSRPPKRHKTYHDRVELTDDFEVVHSRETHLHQRGRIAVETPRSPQKGRTPWTVGHSWAPEEDFEFALDPDGQWYDEQLDASIMETVDVPLQSTQSKPKKREKSKTARRPNVVWKENYRSLYLDELIRWEGRGDTVNERNCRDCSARGIKPPRAPEYRCLDCIVADLTCRDCCLRRHRVHPLHVIEQWDGFFFRKVSLKSLGLRVQLGHVSMRCSNPVPGSVAFQILHTNGIHDVSIDYCGCERAEARNVQLLRRGFYPATQLSIKTSATFRLLSSLHLLTLTSKASMYDFYRMLEKMTNNTGVQTPKFRYRALSRMALQWRHLKMLKRAGRGHDPTGVAGTQPGELAIPCPSCPHPGVNLPVNWENMPSDSQYLYSRILCMDANFRLKNQLVSNYSTDPGLGIGLAYFVQRGPYEEYVLSRTDADEIRTCVGFAALAKATTVFSRGLRYTGVGAVSCGRSEMLLPNAVGNLQKGERYSNMDYIFGSAICKSKVGNVDVSYDISCEWFKNLLERIRSHWPLEIQPPPGLMLCPLVPKLHEPAHKREGHARYSFNFATGVGLTDGECPERIWSAHNSVGNATKTQGPGSRHDVLDDHFGFWNFSKYISMGTSLIRKYKAAVRDRNLQVEAHRGFTSTIPEEIVKRWEDLCIAWERSPCPRPAESPYDVDNKCLSAAAVRKELADKEEDRLKKGGVALHKTSPAAFLIMGLELEDAQRRLKRLVKHGTTVGQGASLTEQRNMLRSRIRAWEQLRAIYMPGLLQFRTETAPSSPNASPHPEDEDLWLPSTIPAERRDFVCVADLPIMEDRLRTAQCKDSLDGLRHILQVKTRMIQFKNKNVRGQREGTRSRTLIDRVHNCARNYAEKYRAARAAKYRLVGEGTWEQSLKVLLDSDIRSCSDTGQKPERGRRKGTLEDDELEALQEKEGKEIGSSLAEGDDDINLLPQIRPKRDGTGATRKQLSWIWCTPGVASTLESAANDNPDILRPEWAKSRACAGRATEEVCLVREEMRRTLAYLQWKSDWWLTRRTSRASSDKAMAEGIAAYASQQAHLQDALASSFRTLWRTPLDELERSTNEDEQNGDGADDVDDLDGDDEDEVDDGDAGEEATGMHAPDSDEE